MHNILHVDDSKAIHAFVSEILKDQKGVQLHHAYNGSEAFEELNKDPGICGVLLDWEMPGMTGIEVLAKLREQGFAGRIIMVTSKNAPDDIKKALTQGAEDYIMKPFTADILLDKLKLEHH